MYDRYSYVRLFNFNGNLDIVGALRHEGCCQHQYNGTVRVGAVDFPKITNNCNARHYFNKQVTCTGNLSTSRNVQFSQGLTVNGVFAYNLWDTRCFMVLGSGKSMTVGALETTVAAGTENWWQIAYGATSGSVRPVTITGVGESPTEKLTQMTIDGLVSININAYDGFVQTFSGRTHSMSKSITVSRGAMKLKGATLFNKVPSLTIAAGASFIDESTAQGALSGVTALNINGSMTSVGNPFGQSKIDLTLGSNSELTLGENETLTVKTLVVNGHEKSPGNYTNARLPQLKSGTLIVLSGPAAAEINATWTAGGGENVSVANPNNWSDEEVDVTSGDLIPTFASAGLRAMIDQEVLFRGLYFRSPDGVNGFSLEGFGENAAIKLFAPEVAILDDDNNLVARYDVGVPIIRQLDDMITLTIPTNKTLALSGGLSTTGSVNVEGKGVLELGGTNLVEKTFTITNKTLKVSGLLAAPGRNNQGLAKDVVGTTALTVYGGTTARETLILNNATIEKPIYVAGENFTYPFHALANTTNVIGGNIRFASNNMSGFMIDDDAVIVSTGGVRRSSTGIIQYGRGTMRIDGDYLMASHNNGYKINDGTLVLGTTNNEIKRLALGYTRTANGQEHPKVEFTTSRTLIKAADSARVFVGVIQSSGIVHSSIGGATIEFNSTTQRVAQITGSAIGLLHGNEGALLIVDGNQSDTTGLSASQIYLASQISGALSVHMAGTGTLLLKGQDFATTGDLIVTNGVIELASDASWHNGEKVIVKEEGLLKLNSRNNLNKQLTKLFVSDNGMIEVPVGVRVTVAEAYVNGNRLEEKAYNKTNATWISGDGSIQVGQSGTVILLR